MRVVGALIEGATGELALPDATAHVFTSFVDRLNSMTFAVRYVAAAVSQGAPRGRACAASLYGNAVHLVPQSSDQELVRVSLLMSRIMNTHFHAAADDDVSVASRPSAQTLFAGGICAYARMSLTVHMRFLRHGAELLSACMYLTSRRTFVRPPPSLPSPRRA